MCHLVNDYLLRILFSLNTRLIISSCKVRATWLKATVFLTLG